MSVGHKMFALICSKFCNKSPDINTPYYNFVVDICVYISMKAMSGMSLKQCNVFFFIIISKSSKTLKNHKTDKFSA